MVQPGLAVNVCKLIALVERFHCSFTVLVGTPSQKPTAAELKAKQQELANKFKGSGWGAGKGNSTVVQLCSLNIFIAYIYMQGVGVQITSTLYTPSPQVSTKQCHDKKQMNMSYEYMRWIDMTYYNHAC